MTVNGVTKSVLIPLPKTRAQGRPLAAKLSDGARVIVTANSTTDNRAGKILGAVALSPAAATTGQQPRTVPLLTGNCPDKRTIVTVKPAVTRYQLPAVVTNRPRFSVVSPANAVAVVSPSGKRRIVHISPPSATSDGPVRLPVIPVSVVRPTLSNRYSTTAPFRPIILRKAVTPAPARSTCTVVIRPSTPSAVSAVSKVTDTSSLSPTSALTVISSPRTLSQREAVAAGWYSDGDVDEKQAGTAAEDQLQYPIRHIVPMELDCSEHSSDINNGDSQHESESEPCASDETVVDKLMCSDAAAESGLLQPDDDRIVIVNNETQMKVIEIFPDDAGTASDRDEEENVDDVKPVKVECCASNALADDDLSRQCSSVSTETALSDAELSSSSCRENFVVLAEWSQDDFLQTATDKPATGTGRRTKRRKRKSPKSNWFRYRRRSSVTVYKARRTGGRPKTAEERHGIVDSFVSLPVLLLAKSSVDVRNAWRYFCCRGDQIQRCRCGTVPPPPRSTVSQTTTPANGSAIRKFAETMGLIQPSMVASGPATLPVQLSGPTSVDGVTPLLVRQPDGKLASVVAKRTTPGGTTLDANKKKYLLIKTKTGSFLMPVDSIAGSSPATEPTPITDAAPFRPPSPPTSKDVKDVKPAVVTDTSGHRERIQQLRERLRQQEEQLQSIRSQLNSSAVQKFDLDSIRY